MGESKIDYFELDKMPRAKKPYSEIAKHFGVTKGRISQAKKEMRNQINKVTTLEKAAEVVHEHLDMAAQLRKTNSVINEQLDNARVDIEGEKGKDRRETQRVIIGLSAEIRKQLDTPLRIFEAWQDSTLNADFQLEVFSILDQLQPGVRDEAIRRLKEKRALRGLVQFN